MLRKSDYCKVYKNGNITVKYDRDKIQESKKDPVLTIVDVLWWIDCNFIGETYCLSNYETGHTVYNAYSDLVYIFPWRYLEDLEAGKTVRLYAMQPDENDREKINEELGMEE
jgi:hypothetical protein